ncbi:MAG: Wzy polymerase domain-containing protein [Pseudomonadota bacterium]
MELAVISRPALPRFWLVAGAVALSLAWILPNHYPPWSSFHMDAWSALVLAALALAVILRSPREIAWHGLAVMAAVLCCIPWIQYAGELIPLSGTSWIACAYLLGLCLAILVGGRWESTSPGQVMDFLFLAISVAALISVGLQLHQWLMLDLLDIWSMGQGYGRPFANFGQPNQLGTLLLWALLGITWAIRRGQLGLPIALAHASYLLFGLALTGSRTAWVAVLLLVAACWIWRKLWVNKWIPWLVTGLAAIFAIYVLSIGTLSEILMIAPAEPQDIARVGTETRPVIWTMFVDAVLRHPFVGYGWGPLSSAQIEVAPDHPVLNTVYSHSHNLILDLVLWCGIPVGLAVICYLARWLWLQLKRTDSAETALMLLFILVVFNHAMLEFPLQYAYFLLPAGLVMGALDSRSNVPALWRSGRKTAVGIWLVLAVLLMLLIRDYSRVERAYQVLRFEWAGYTKQASAQPPEVMLLDQWKGFVWYVRLEPSEGMNASDIELMRALTRLYPSAGFFHKLATALALNDRPEEALWWLRRVCKIASPFQCVAVQRAWAMQSKANAKIATVAWPVSELPEPPGSGQTLKQP